MEQRIIKQWQKLLWLIQSVCVNCDAVLAKNVKVSNNYDGIKKTIQLRINLPLM